MLVLSRKIDESIILDGDIEIVVTAIHGNRVSLGIIAPKDVRIRRSELPIHTVEKTTVTGIDPCLVIMANQY